MAYFDNTCAKLVVYHRVSKSINHFYYTCKRGQSPFTHFVAQRGLSPMCHF